MKTGFVLLSLLLAICLVLVSAQDTTSVSDNSPSNTPSQNPGPTSDLSQKQDTSSTPPPSTAQTDSTFRPGPTTPSTPRPEPTPPRPEPTPPTATPSTFTPPTSSVQSATSWTQTTVVSTSQSVISTTDQFGQPTTSVTNVVVTLTRDIPQPTLGQNESSATATLQHSTLLISSAFALVLGVAVGSFGGLLL